MPITLTANPIELWPQRFMTINMKTDEDIMPTAREVGLPFMLPALRPGLQFAAYPFPNDFKSGTNEKIAHHLFLRILDDKLYLAPIESPQRIVDLGTGTGQWAEGMADRFENATVLGIDLSPQHDEYVQPNLTFEVDNIQKEWPPRKPFDFVHMRSLFGSIDDWPAVYSECFKYGPEENYQTIR